MGLVFPPRNSCVKGRLCPPHRKPMGQPAVSNGTSVPRKGTPVWISLTDRHMRISPTIRSRTLRFGVPVLVAVLVVSYFGVAYLIASGVTRADRNEQDAFPEDFGLMYEDGFIRLSQGRRDPRRLVHPGPSGRADTHFRPRHQQRAQRRQRRSSWRPGWSTAASTRCSSTSAPTVCREATRPRTATTSGSTCSAHSTS